MRNATGSVIREKHTNIQSCIHTYEYKTDKHTCIHTYICMNTCMFVCLSLIRLPVAYPSVIRERLTDIHVFIPVAFLIVCV